MTVTVTRLILVHALDHDSKFNGHSARWEFSTKSRRDATFLRRGFARQTLPAAPSCGGSASLTAKCVLYTQDSKPLDLECLHALGFLICLMIIAKQMQNAMHQHMRPMGSQWFFLLQRLLRNDRRADYQIAKQVADHAWRRLEWKRQHVGRPILLPVVAIQGLAFGCINNAYGQLSLGPLRLQGRQGPASEIGL